MASVSRFSFGGVLALSAGGLRQTRRKMLSRSTIAAMYHASSSAMKVVVEVVPPLGESITEGSISSWMKSEGDSVAVDDVIAVVETDKVTVDIKANSPGIFLRRLASETIEVGKDLYEMDTSSDASASPKTNSEASSSPSSSGNDHVNDDHSSEVHGRQPLIHFIGKRIRKPIDLGALQPTAPGSAKTSIAPSSSHASPANSVKRPAAPAKKPSVDSDAVSFTALKNGAWFGRPALTEKEIEAVESGGACYF